MMNINKIMLVIPVLLLSISSQAQIDSLVVETYYIADEKDASDTDGGNLAEGSVTYRIFLDLEEGYRLMNIFGTSDLPLIVSSTEGVYNNTDRGGKYGYDIGANRLEDNTTALDSWLTLGFASTEHLGILKDLDDTGSIVGGVNNDGGSENIQGGLLANDDPQAGLPLTISDGLISAVNISNDFDAFGISDTSIFGSTFNNEFAGREVAITSADGVPGTSDQNLVLIAQITTLGEISLKVNVTVRDSLDTEYVFKYSDELLAEGESFSKWLTYPFKSGCTDPDYLEFDPGAVIGDNSCATPIFLGCTDTSACNYDPDANFNVVELCCYTRENCGGRDIYEVCEHYTLTEEEQFESALKLYPNPVFRVLNVEAPNEFEGRYIITLSDFSGRLLVKSQSRAGQHSTQLDMGTLKPGIYLVRISAGNYTATRKIVKY